MIRKHESTLLRAAYAAVWYVVLVLALNSGLLEASAAARIQTSQTLALPGFTALESRRPS